MSTRIYVVDDTESTSPAQLVRAGSQAAAIAAVVRNRYSAHVASQDDILELAQLGVKLIEAGAEAPQS